MVTVLGFKISRSLRRFVGRGPGLGRSIFGRGWASCVPLPLTLPGKPNSP